MDRFLSPTIFAFLFVSTLASLPACAPLDRPAQITYTKTADSEAPDRKLTDNHHTGSAKTVKLDDQSSAEVPYTIAGYQNIFNELRSEVESGTDMTIAKNIENVSLFFMDNKNERIEENPSRFQLNIKFAQPDLGSPLELKFTAAFSLNKKNRQALDVLQAEAALVTFPYTADVICKDQACTLVKIHLKKRAPGHAQNIKDSLVLAQIGILHRLSHPKIRILKDKDTTHFSSLALQELEKNAAQSKTLKESFMVVKGVSGSKIRLLDSSSPAAPDFLNIETELLETAKTSPEIKNIKIKDNEQLSGVLIGNDPESGSLMFDINEKTGETARMIVEDLEANISLAETFDHQMAQRSRDAKALFKVTFSPQLPESARVTKAFAKYATHSEVQRLIQVWLNKKPDLSEEKCRAGNYNFFDLQKFLTYAPNIAPYLEGLVEKLDITPEIGYLLLLESQYAKSPHFPADQRPLIEGATALGPWQIINDTAEFVADRTRIPFNYSRAAEADPSDDRTYFLNSSYMAAGYLQYLFDLFPNDPALAIFGYNAGQGNALDTVKEGKKSLKNILKYPITLADIFQYRIRTEEKPYCKSINYAFAFLAARTIGQNQKAYGLTEIVKPVKTDAYKMRLKNPRGVLPEGI